MAVNERAIAYLQPQADPNLHSVEPGESAEPSRIVVLADDGTTIDEIEVKEIRGDVTSLDLSPTGTDLLYTTSRGELIWYALDSFEASGLLMDGTTHDGHFTADGLVVAVGVDGVQLIDVHNEQAEVDFGVGREHGQCRVRFGTASRSDVGRNRQRHALGRRQRSADQPLLAVGW